MHGASQGDDVTSDRTTYIVQGEYRVSRDPDELLSAVLGSCVAVCLWDPTAKLGGMNHFLLPFAKGEGGSGTLRYVAYAIEVLINEMLKMGARRSTLQAKLFGGATVTENLGPIGKSNGDFALKYLATEDIPCVAKSLGGSSARRVVFRPATGQVRQLIVGATAMEPQRPTPPPARRVQGGADVVLF